MSLHPVSPGSTGVINWFYGASPPAGGEFKAGDIWVLPADDTNGVEWLFRCHNEADTYPWRFVGGSPLFAGGSGPATAINANTQVGSSGSYYSASTMSVTVPRAGDYDIVGIVSVADAGFTTYVEAYSFVGSTRGRRVNGAIWSTVNGAAVTAVSDRLTGVSASTVVGICVDSGANGTAQIYSDLQSVKVTPIRVS